VASVTFSGVTKRFDDVVAVNALDLEVADGELLVLLGPSGCGKTTALRMVAGLEEVTDGDLAIGDLRVNDLAPKDRDVAMVFQSYALYPHMTVQRNIEFPLKRQGVAAAERSSRVLEAATTLGLDELLERKPGQLSGGQRQRVALARAIVRAPRVFLMDEPLSNLDATLRVQTRSDIVAIQRRLGTTTIYVTHDQVEAMTMGHRIAVMRNGALEQVASPTDLYDRPATAFVASFLGSPGMNLLAATGFTGHDGTPGLRAAGAELPWPDGFSRQPSGDVTLGFRPEAASLGSEGLDARIILVERLGAETHLICSLANGERVVVRQRDRQSSHQISDHVRIRIDTDQIHLFDAESGLRLGEGT
jgi:multiple sugar transport system ATP-binding protein